LGTLFVCLTGIIVLTQGPVPPGQPTDTQPAIQVDRAREQSQVELRPLTSEDGPDVEEERAALETQLSAAARPGEQAELLLRRANWLLAAASEPHASRFLLEIERPDDRAAWSELIDRAQRDVEAARELLERMPEPASEEEEEQADTMRATADTLQAFARLFSGLCAADGADGNALYAVTAELSLYLDDENRALARAANLWQAVVLRTIGQPDRARDYLELPLSTPGKAYAGLFIRWQRLHCLADEDQLPAALVLALRMEESCNRWFTDAARREPATRGCMWQRLKLYERYQQQLEERGRTA
jgi:hypothetical protein